MKKLFLLFIFTLCVNSVNAIDITNDTEIKYKWYHEEVTESFYYPKKDKLDNYLEDPEKIEYGEVSDWSAQYCDYPDDNYLIEQKIITKYDRVNKIKYIKIVSASTTCPTGKCIDDIKIYYNQELVQYKIISEDYYGFLIELPQECEPEKLIFYIKTEHLNVIYLSKTENIAPINISMPATTENIIFFNDSWKIKEPAYITVETETTVPNIPHIKNVETYTVCRVQEIKTYRYKLEKQYYDNNYHQEVKGYIPDITNPLVNYTKEFPKEKIKEVIVPKIEKEYVYLKDEIIKDNIDTESGNKENIVYQTKYIDRVTNKVPTKIYIILISLILIIIICIIKMLSKKVD